MNVYQKIATVMSSVAYIQKDGFVETGKGRGYKAVTDEKVITSIRPALISAGLIIIPVARDVRRTDEVVTGYDGSQKINRITEVDVTYRIINVDDPSDYIEVVSSGAGVDTQDKGIGKAMTYARKYMFLNTFQIPTGEDADDISSDVYTEKLYGKNKNVTTNDDRTDHLRMQVIELARMKGLEEQMRSADYKGKSFDDLDEAGLADLKVKLARRQSKEQTDESTSK